MKQGWLVNKEHFFTALSNGLKKAKPVFVVKGLFHCFLLFSYLPLFSQETPSVEAFRKVVIERAAKIINVLQLKDAVQYNKILTAVAGHYIITNQIHENSNAKIITIKKEDTTDTAKKVAVASEEALKMAMLAKQHDAFLDELQKTITAEEVEKIKDGMTYKIYPITYSAYQDMLPNLSAEQKLKVEIWLKEARELAMDAESAEKKHAVFGKYKGRINNYLSASGYELKKETEAWQKRIKEREAIKNSNQDTTKE